MPLSAKADTGREATAKDLKSLAQKLQKESQKLIQHHFSKDSPGMDFPRKSCPSQMRVTGTETQAANHASKKDNQTLVFVSFSLPEASLRMLAQSATAHNATLVIRGLYQNSFIKTAQKIQEIFKGMEGVGMDINPELFDAHHITAVPTFVKVKDGKPVCTLKGNVSLAFAAKKLEEVP